LLAQGLSTQGLAQRVMALPAQVSAPNFGIAEQKFAQLAHECDAVVHNAASVSLVRSYISARGPNVLGTRESLRFAMRGQPKTFHHISTLAVASLTGATLPESFVSAQPGRGDGYTQSKWAAEELVKNAIALGLEASVYRLGRVVGPVHTGIINEQDLVFRLLQASVSLGAFPELPIAEPWTPVDIVARAVVGLAMRPERPRVLHFAPAKALALPELFGWLRSYGYPLEQVSLSAFCARLRASASAAHQALSSFFEARPTATPEADLQAPIRRDATQRALTELGLDFPDIDGLLARRYLDHCVRSGFLPAPERPSVREHF
jgi:nonribosomal peptide synthetase MxcG